MKRTDIKHTKEELWEILDYKEGRLYWKIRPPINKKNKHFNSNFAGKFAGFYKNKATYPGYYYIKIHNISYFSHRIIYKMFYDDEPSHIDHINGNPSDNKIENLRKATAVENTRNRKNQINNKTGCIGVSYCYKSKKFYARISTDNKRVSLGYFKTFEEAVEARKMAEEKYFGEFASPEGR